MGEDERETEPSPPSERPDAAPPSDGEESAASGDRRDSASSTDRGDRKDRRCEHCGSVIDTTDWYPVTKERDADGRLRFYFFCREDCQDAWLDDRPE